MINNKLITVINVNLYRYLKYTQINFWLYIVITYNHYSNLKYNLYTFIFTKLSIKTMTSVGSRIIHNNSDST